jgi:hypothetical protein
MSDDPRDPSLEDVLDLIAARVLSRIRGFEIGQIKEYDPSRQTVTVQPVVGRAQIGQDGSRSTKLTSAIYNVPVWFFGGGGVRATCPLASGDYGLIMFCSVSLDRWKRRGGRIVDPGDDRRHNETDAIFVPGIHPPDSPPTPAPADALVLHAGSKVIRAGGPTGAQKTLRADDFLSALDTLLGSIQTAVGTITGGTAAAADILTAIHLFQNTLTRSGYKTSKFEAV